MLPRVMTCRLVQEYRVELTFTDGVRAELDLRDRVVGRGGLLAPLADLNYFARVRVDREAGTLAWPNGVDLCPDVLYHEATGAPLPGDHEG